MVPYCTTWIMCVSKVVAAVMWSHSVRNPWGHIMLWVRRDNGSCKMFGTSFMAMVQVSFLATHRPAAALPTKRPQHKEYCDSGSCPEAAHTANKVVDVGTPKGQPNTDGVCAPWLHIVRRQRMSPTTTKRNSQIFFMRLQHNGNYAHMKWGTTSATTTDRFHSSTFMHYATRV